MSKLDAFILAQEKRHSFIVSEMQKGEQRVIDELKEHFEPRISSLEHHRSRTEGIIKGLSIAWAIMAAAVGFAYKNQEAIKGLGK